MFSPVSDGELDTRASCADTVSTGVKPSALEPRHMSLSTHFSSYLPCSSAYDLSRNNPSQQYTYQIHAQHHHHHAQCHHHRPMHMSIPPPCMKSSINLKPSACHLPIPSPLPTPNASAEGSPDQSPCRSPHSVSSGVHPAFNYLQSVLKVQENNRKRLVSLRDTKVKTPEGHKEACEELKRWCADVRAYNTELTADLDLTLRTITDKALNPGYDVDVALEVLYVVGRFQHIMSPLAADNVLVYTNCLHNHKIFNQRLDRAQYNYGSREHTIPTDLYSLPTSAGMVKLELPSSPELTSATDEAESEEELLEFKAEDTQMTEAASGCFEPQAPNIPHGIGNHDVRMATDDQTKILEYLASTVDAMTDIGLGDGIDDLWKETFVGLGPGPES
ncbi:hypothetical protein HDU85_001261 [Gaertneriomyces sp. JEL0708]|nr:hypothetical protein HDU85_001261 [Gaertneriomyces sp. JEL0708]